MSLVGALTFFLIGLFAGTGLVDILVRWRRR